MALPWHGTAAPRAALPIPIGVCSTACVIPISVCSTACAIPISVCSTACVQTMVRLPVLGILTCIQMLTHATYCTLRLYGHRKRVCTESGLWEKNPLPHLGLEPASVLRLAFQLDALPTELSPPLLVFTPKQSCFENYQGWID